MSKYIVGIDEAGRGPVIGPMVICAYMIKEIDKNKLREVGARDSKTLTKQSRERLYSTLSKVAFEIKTKHVSAAEIDELRKNYTLNVIEQKIMIKATKEFSVIPDEIYIDAADVKEKRFGEAFQVEFPKATIISRHKADKYYPVVSAASIIAKVQRDREIVKISSKLKIDLGSGYPNDPKTISYLKRTYKQNKKFPPFVRESWDTAKKIKNQINTKKMTDFTNN
ncbi:MAG: ribonuclease HII [Candidatus Heimdallarchaeota archaeon]|nr:ribonuclease HII [Candidatus Heimdallarchaeota archaeon]MCK4878354.1 ribonuclease HII [Candidatus Heimdallarchaeota archaeon]